MSESSPSDPISLPPRRSSSLEELALQYEATAVDDLESWAADIWGSDEELDEFIADVRRSRDAFPA